MPIHINDEDIAIRNIDTTDLADVLKCVNQSTDSVKAMGRASLFSLEEIQQRYLETLINSLEFFCCIEYKGNKVGILKGRYENKQCRELCILSLILIEQYRGVGLGTKILTLVENYFTKLLNVNKFNALIMESNTKVFSFWEKNNYKLARVTKTHRDEQNSGMIIYEKSICSK